MAEGWLRATIGLRKGLDIFKAKMLCRRDWIFEKMTSTTR